MPRGHRGDRGRRSPEPLPEVDVLAFISENHPELLKSIDWLKEQRPIHYKNALRGISGQLRRLKGIQKRSEDRYEQELNLWKIDSRIRLLAGQQTLNPDDKREAELKRLIAEDMTLRPRTELARIREQIELLEKRHQKMEERITQGPNEKKVNQRLEDILERTRGRMESVKGSGKGRRNRPKPDSAPNQDPQSGEE